MLKLCLHRSGLENYLSKLCSSRKNPYAPLGRSLEIPRGRGIFKVKILEAEYEAKLELPGGGGGAKQKTFHGESMDIFWNCTMLSCNSHKKGIQDIRTLGSIKLETATES